MTPGALVSGRVRDASGVGGGAATVSLFNTAGALVARTTTNTGGGYGTYHLSFDVGRCDGSVARTNIAITIAARGGQR